MCATVIITQMIMGARQEDKWGPRELEPSPEMAIAPRVCTHSHSVVSSSCHPMDCSPPGSSVHGILQARILEWGDMPSSKESSWPRDQTCISSISCIAGGLFTAEPRKLVYIYKTQLITYCIYIQRNSIAITNTALAEFLILGTSL